MRAKLSSYALVEIDAVPVDAMVKGQQVKVVAARVRRVLHSVRLPVLDAGTPPIGSPVQATLRNPATARFVISEAIYSGGSVAIFRESDVGFGFSSVMASVVDDFSGPELSEG
jgi:hypothetical protein